MRSRPDPRGVTLIEVMMALAILLIAATGIVGIHNQGVLMLSDARKMTQATAIAGDLVEQLASWDFATDPRLLDRNSSNNATVGDPAFESQDPTSSYVLEYREADLAAGPWYGIPTASLPQGYERFWNVADTMTPTGQIQEKRIAVIVRWRHGDGKYRRVVLVTARQNPAVYR